MLRLREEQAKHFGESTEPWKKMGYVEMARNLYGSWYEEWEDEYTDPTWDAPPIENNK